jgi:PAS domain S-box-containing protein
LEARVAELEASEQSYRGLVDSQDDLILRRDPEGRITWVNDAFCLLFARSRAELIGSRFEPVRLDRVPDAGHTGHAAYGDAEDRCLMTVSGPRWYAFVEIPVRDGAGGVVAWQSVGRDVTARKATERALAEAGDKAAAGSEAKSRFLAVMSHEMRTPLNGILGMAGLLLDTRLSAEQTTYAKAVKTSGEGLLALIDDILDFSKIEAGRLDFAREPFEVETLVEEVVELLAPRAHGKGIEIVGVVDPTLPRALQGDAARLRQILTNLAANAVKFTEKGGVTIRAARDGEALVLSVADTGIGIAAEALSRIFGEFEQASAETSRLYGGTGLGLAITRRLAEAMGGSVDVESMAGRGSVFSVALPLIGDAEPRALEAPLAGRRVLIVSPASVEAAALEEEARVAGARARRVGTVGEGAAALAREQPDVIVADRRLGRAGLRKLVARAETLEPRPRCVVLLTPQNRGEIAGLRAAGWQAYLVRPVRRVSLLAQLGTGAPPAVDPRMAFDETTRGSGEGPRLTVLLAEDNPINALLATALIERSGHHVTRVVDGRAAVDAWAAGPSGDGASRFDLVLMDVQMPVLDGTDAAREIRAREAEAGLARTPIVALTANAFVEDRAAVLAAGMDEHLAKPLERDRLQTLLDRVAAGPARRAS